MRSSQHAKNKQDRAAQAALLIAAASIPNTFQKTLMPRDTTDQGLVTGLTMSVNYGLISTIRKGLEDISDQLAGTTNARDDDYNAHVRQRRFMLLIDALTIGAATLSEQQFKQKEEENELRGIIRTTSRWVKYAAIAGLATGLLQEAAEAVYKPRDKKGKRKITRFPVGVVGGAVFAGYTELQKRKSEKGWVQDDGSKVNTLEAIAMGAGVLGALSGINYGQRKAADILSDQMDKVLPGSQDFWWSLGHATAVVGTGLGIVSLMRRVYHRIEEVATEIEPAYLEPPVSEYVSSGAGSGIGWDSLSVQGRRFVSGAITKKQIADTLGTRAKDEPIRVFVGLDSAPTEGERVALAVKELERTGAFSRSTIMLISPTGTGYVNYVAVESAELMSRGDIASVVLQYSKRPSPMSLDRVPEGRKQFRMILKEIDTRIKQLPESKRPQLVVFGESLGAWTSQDAFVEQGTDGLVYAGIDKALWIGSPYGSKWKTQVLGTSRPDVTPDLVGKFDNIKELRKLSPAKRSKLRYVMITHYNDAVTLFGASLLYKQPDWLEDPSKRPPTVSKSQYYTSPGTFLLTLVDMKNSMNVIPGKFEASGHDYRADLPEFVREVYGYSVTAAQMRKIESFLRQNELNRAEMLKPKQ